MAVYSNYNEVEKIRIASRTSAKILDVVCSAVKPGISTGDLEELAKQTFLSMGATSPCLGYPSSFRGAPPFPAYICLSVNDEIVHGIGSPDRILSPGDIVSIDIVAEKGGYMGDNARTVAVGTIAPNVAKLLEVTREALFEGIAAAVVGNHIGDISHAIQSYVTPYGFGIVRDFVGHGVGRTMHEEPQIPNYGRPGSGPKIKAGMILAIEPMINLGTHKIEISPDGWTVYTADGLPSAHFEHTVYVTKHGPQILTLLPSKAGNEA